MANFAQNQQGFGDRGLGGAAMAEILRNRLFEPGFVVQDRSAQPRQPIEPTLDHPIIKVGNNGPLDNTPVYEVPPGHFFAVGDNRDNSQDRRVLSAVGYVPAENLVGRAQFLFFSTDGTARWWEIWKWPFAIRYRRLLNGVG